MASNTKEIWKQITELKGKTTKNYGISNLGNLCSFEKSLNDKTIIKQRISCKTIRSSS